MACQDGFITSHAVENISLIETEKVKEFVGSYEPENFLLNADMPMAVGPYANSPFYMETKMNQRIAMKNAKKIILEVAAEFEKISGRKYGLSRSIVWMTPVCDRHHGFCRRNNEGSR